MNFLSNSLVYLMFKVLLDSIINIRFNRVTKNVSGQIFCAIFKYDGRFGTFATHHHLRSVDCHWLCGQVGS